MALCAVGGLALRRKEGRRCAARRGPSKPVIHHVASLLVVLLSSCPMVFVVAVHQLYPLIFYLVVLCRGEERGHSVGGLISRPFGND